MMILNDVDQIRKHIIEIFKPVQVTAAIHQKNAILLKRIYENVSELQIHVYFINN